MFPRSAVLVALCLSSNKRSLVGPSRPCRCSLGLLLLPLLSHLEDLEGLRVGLVRKDVVIVLLPPSVVPLGVLQGPLLLDLLGLLLLNLLHRPLLAQPLFHRHPAVQQQHPLLLVSSILHCLLGTLIHVPRPLNVAGASLKLSGGDEHLDVRRSLQETLVQGPGLVVVLLSNLKVNVCLPEHLGHVQERLLDAELKQRPRPVELPQRLLELREGGPGAAVGGKALEHLLVDGAHAVDVAELEFQLDV
mmetsp:Transcript_47899/g.119754  ORF Transcript_47899/g.119754 Transcript_47899/m.119754 type:complete len:247 (-) Transcript_47899:1326-2066(-)